MAVIDGTRGNDTLIGTDDADVIAGKGGDDELRGFGGNDNLRGNKGNDNLRGNKGNDTLDGGIGDDTLAGGAGVDTADYGNLVIKRVSGTIAGLDVDLRANASASGAFALHSSTNNALSWTDALSGIENVIGTHRNDRFIGNAADNVFDGGSEVGRDDRVTTFADKQGGQSYGVTADVVEYFGREDQYLFTRNTDGDLVVSSSTRNIGTDTLRDIEFLYFAGQNRLVAVEDLEISAPNGAPTITSSATPSVAENQTAVIDLETTDDVSSEG
ncbi:MAG: hypothetical protein AAGG47_17375, partial [Pseudomonadota bacterium]